MMSLFKNGAPWHDSGALLTDVKIQQQFEPSVHFSTMQLRWSYHHSHLHYLSKAQRQRDIRRNKHICHRERKDASIHSRLRFMTLSLQQHKVTQTSIRFYYSQFVKANTSVTRQKWTPFLCQKYKWKQSSEWKGCVLGQIATYSISLMLNYCVVRHDNRIGNVFEFIHMSAEADRCDFARTSERAEWFCTSASFQRRYPSTGEHINRPN